MSAVLVLVGQSVAALTGPFLHRALFDDAVKSEDSGYLVALVIGLVGLWAVKGLLWAGRATLLARLSAQVLTSLRESLLDRRLWTPSVEAVSIPKKLAPFTEHLDALESLLIEAGPRALIGVLVSLMSFVALFLVKWDLALVFLVSLPLAAVPPALTRARVATSTKETREAKDALLVSLQDILSAQHVIRAFGLESWWRSRFLTGATVLEGRSRSVALWTLLTQGGTEVGADAVLTVAIVVSAGFVFAGHLTMGALFAFLGLLLNVVAGIRMISESVPTLVRASESLAVLEAELQGEDRETPAGASGTVPVFRDSIELRDVSFGYVPGSPVLDGLSCRFGRGERTAIVGPSGSGKSTVVRLLLGLDRHGAGEILWDGQDTSTLDPGALRSHCAIVFQEASLFGLSVRDNIRMGRLDATNEEIEHAARQARIHSTILAMPDGYDTVLNPAASNLSGGQRQRIAIARALVRDPAILVLDEATSALDPGTEAVINETLAVLSRGRTVISVTHRVASARDADRVLVLDQGRLVEAGDPESLLAQEGLFAELFRHQARFSLGEDGSPVDVSPDGLRSIPILSRLPTSALERLATQFEVEHVRADVDIIRQGEIGERFYVIVRGTTSVRETGADGVEKEIRKCIDGDYFGEIALLRNVRRTASVRSLTPCVLLSLSQVQLEELLEQEQVELGPDPSVPTTPSS
ncbi:MAG: ATP-binding cassette domain-containing protein [Alphaproteobacteria bacterium]|nr:ATP-binding cassette domain-containing protein [Alphaproteobacteria bacterium]MCB9694377.1 ATP-binding cassette domain-containing protein [Alphaproteobacteria bacterium]